jgi:glycerophosphoryl diester phosphodiesterase
MMAPKLVGHRGARFEAPENTVAGFLYSRGLGISIFELDVRLSKDGKLVVMHDAEINRTTNGEGKVANFTAAELAALDARSIHGNWPERVGVPELSDVFATFDGDRAIEWEVEIKTDAPERLDALVPLLLAEIERFGIADNVHITSFDRTALERVRASNSTIKLGFIGKYDTDDDVNTALELGASRAGIPITTGSSDIVQAALAQGLTVVGWPSNDAYAWRTLTDWGVTHLCTDSPKAALEYLDGVESGE